MGNEQPMVLATNENVRDLYNRLVEAVGKSGGDARGASNPTHIAFHAHPDAAQSDANPLGVGKKPRPAVANFVPTQEQVPAGMNALDCVVVRPDSFHLGQVE